MEEIDYEVFCSVNGEDCFWASSKDIILATKFLAELEKQRPDDKPYKLVERTRKIIKEIW